MEPNLVGIVGTSGGAIACARVLGFSPFCSAFVVAHLLSVCVVVRACEEGGRACLRAPWRILVVLDLLLGLHAFCLARARGPVNCSLVGLSGISWIEIRWSAYACTTRDVEYGKALTDTYGLLLIFLCAFIFLLHKQYSTLIFARVKATNICYRYYLVDEGRKGVPLLVRTAN